MTGGGFGDHGAAIGMRDHDRRAALVEYRPDGSAAEARSTTPEIRLT
jgi:hypothetical protein